MVCVCLSGYCSMLCLCGYFLQLSLLSGTISLAVATRQTHSLSSTMSSTLCPSLSPDSCNLLTHRDTSLFCCSLVAFCHLQAAWAPARGFTFLPSFFLHGFWFNYSVGLNTNHWPKLADLISKSSQIIDNCYHCKHMVCKFLILNLTLLFFQSFISIDLLPHS